ncbi:MAG TPA: SCO family protein [Candidatus Tectomicrobia bacterium]|nr:SCO family protein [Candidatus Tectomicrobia bacterium]
MGTFRVFSNRSTLLLVAALGLGVLCMPAALSAHTWAPPLEFSPPAPGTYTLPIVKPAPDGDVVDAAGTPRRLFDSMHGKIVLLSFIYTRCSDARGCPLATAVLHAVEETLQHETILARQVRLLSLSFDPDHDTPEVLRRYASVHASPGGRAYGTAAWHHLTTSSPQALQPILEGYGQYVLPILDAHGEFSGTYSHTLKVFLIDRRQHVRNIYSVDFLHPEVLINDIKTLLMAEGSL